MKSKSKYLTATIIQISGSDVIYVKQKETSFNKKSRYFRFSLGHIENYRGQTLWELGLRPGLLIEFTLGSSLTIASVRLPKEIK